jgi:rhodanese-related sulfurtransferase
MLAMQQVPHTPYVDVSAVSDDAFILDVREPDEWEVGHVEGSLHIPMGQIPTRADEVPQDRRVVVVCRSGGRSARVTGYLRELGLDVVNLEGGLTAWAAANRALTGPVL